MENRLSKHFRPIENPTHSTPAKYRRIAVRLTDKLTMREVAYLFGVTSSAIQAWVAESQLHKRQNGSS